MFRKYVNKLNNFTFYLNISLVSYGIGNYKYFSEKKRKVIQIQ